MSSPAHNRPRPDQVNAQRKREAAFARISRVRGLVIVAAGGLTALVAAVVSAIAPGHSLGASKARATLSASAATRTASRRSTTSAKMPPLASPGELGLQGPSSAPQSAPQTQTQTQTQPQPAPAPAPTASAPAATSGGS